VEGPVDLEDDDASVRQVPLAVEITAAPLLVLADALALALGQAGLPA
jgi:hypothetical protein